MTNTLRAARSVVATTIGASAAIAAPIAFASNEFFAGLARHERVGVILRRSEYTVQPPLCAQERRRVVFMVRLDGGIGSEIVTIDQALDVSAALLCQNDQVLATIVDSVHVDSKVSPVFGHTSIEQIALSSTFSGVVLRRGEYLVGNHTCVALLVLADKESGARLVELTVDVSELSKISASGLIHVNILADGSIAIV